MFHRRFPSEAPKGKGGRVVEVTGVLVRARAPLMPVVEAYKQVHQQRFRPLEPAGTVAGRMAWPTKSTRKSQQSPVQHAV